MALSNYDIAAWDKFGDPRKASMAFPGNILVEIYKDWVYLYDKSQRGFFIEVSKDITEVYPDSRNMSVIHISEGTLDYKNILLTIERQDNSDDAGNPVFIHAMYKHGYDEYNRYHAYDPQILCGIGKYGFGDHDWIGITKADEKEFAKWLHKIESPVPKIKSAKPYNQGDAFFCGCDAAMERYDGSDATILGTMLGINKKET